MIVVFSVLHHSTNHTKAALPPTVHRSAVNNSRYVLFSCLIFNGKVITHVISIMIDNLDSFLRIVLTVKPYNQLSVLLYIIYTHAKTRNN